MASSLKRKINSEENEIIDDSTSQILLTKPIIAAVENSNLIVAYKRSIADQKKEDNKYNWPGDAGEVFKIESMILPIIL